jgi:dipeptidyl aminopeptidase/acylaminoacyl peptidase
VPLEGVLYKPANFDPSKKYPMIVYLYEKLSENIHHFVDPKPMDSINIAYYVSNGYLVFTPDIVYTIGYPGQSALKCVLAGVNAVTRQGFVDEKNIGIQGHSWVHGDADQPLQGRGGWRAGGEHDLGLRRDTVGSGAAKAVPV